MRSPRAVIAGLLLTACVGAAAFGLQAAAFPRPERGDLLAVQAVQWLLRYRLVRSVEQVDGRPPIHGICLQAWYGPAPGVPRRTLAALLELGSGSRLLTVSHRVEILGLAKGDLAPRARLFLAGCSRLLAARLGARLKRGIDVYLGLKRFGRTLAAGFGVSAKLPRIDFFVRRDDLKPLAVHVVGRSINGWSRLTPGGSPQSIRALEHKFETARRRNARRV
jgi:hypothetical protein